MHETLIDHCVLLYVFLNASIFCGYHAAVLWVPTISMSLFLGGYKGLSIYMNALKEACPLSVSRKYYSYILEKSRTFDLYKKSIQ